MAGISNPVGTVLRHVHVLGHPDLPLKVSAAPENAQVLNCRNMCLLLSRAGVPYTYYGLDGSEVPEGGEAALLGEAGGTWAHRNPWHAAYTARLQAALDERLPTAGTPAVVLSLYGAAHMDIDPGPLPVIEAMVGYDHCWAPYRVFPSYAQQHVIYADPSPHVQDHKWFDTVIPHFLDASEYWVRPEREDYALFLGRAAPDKGIDIAREVSERSGIPLRAVHGGVVGAAKTELIARARVVLMPTLYVEPFGYVAVEAQLCGVPVVTTDWGAFAETVEHGLSGFRCRTQAEFLEALRLVPLLEPGPIRERALRLYDIGAVLDDYLHYFDFVWNVHLHGGYYAPNALRRPLCPVGRREDVGSRFVSGGM
ncbi:MAG: glycosyltransferase [Lentisphaeria bacterium]|nr:glycosyltransferase [Lentisphaeria bacterium]